MGAPRGSAGLMAAERAVSEDERAEREAAATKLAAKRRAQQAKRERERRRQQREQEKADREQAIQAIQAIIRVRQARKQRRLLEEAAELSESLGISKWAALWMLRQDAEKAEAERAAQRAAGEAPAEEVEDGMWGKLMTGDLPEPPAPLEYPSEEEDALAGDEEGDDSGREYTLSDEGDVDEDLADPPPPEPNPNWVYLRAHWRRAVRLMKVEIERETGVRFQEDASTTFARAAKEKLDELRRFKEANPNYQPGRARERSAALRRGRRRRPAVARPPPRPAAAAAVWPSGKAKKPARADG